MNHDKAGGNCTSQRNETENSEKKLIIKNSLTYTQPYELWWGRGNGKSHKSTDEQHVFFVTFFLQLSYEPFEPSTKIVQQH